jgi:hypothetical protein
MRNPKCYGTIKHIPKGIMSHPLEPALKINVALS